jgi:hypothetical protein
MNRKYASNATFYLGSDPNMNCPLLLWGKTLLHCGFAAASLMEYG